MCSCASQNLKQVVALYKKKKKKICVCMYGHSLSGVDRGDSGYRQTPVSMDLVSVVYSDPP
jgi:hypothetical protein